MPVTITFIEINGVQRVARLFVVVLVFSLLACQTNTSASELHLKLDVDDDLLKHGKVVLKAQLSNKSQESYDILLWNTPLEGAINGRYLEVRDRDSGVELDYLGRMIKRTAPTREDYHSIAPGQSISASTDITLSYNFCANRRYTVGFTGYFFTFDQAVLQVETVDTHFKVSDSFPVCD